MSSAEGSVQLYFLQIPDLIGKMGYRFKKSAAFLFLKGKQL